MARFPRRSTSLAIPPRLHSLDERSVPANLTWTGTASGNWSNAANWGGFGFPHDGDNLIFPSSGANHGNTNDINNLALNSMTIAGVDYFIGGNPVTVSGSITDSSNNGANQLLLGISTGAADLTVTVTNANVNPFTIFATIAGPAGLVKAGSGPLELAGNGANTFAGTTTVAAGTLRLNQVGGVAIPGPLVDSSTVVLLRNDQIRAAVTSPISVTANATLDLGNFTNTVGPLTLNGGKVQSTAIGQLTLGGDIVTLANASASVIVGRFALGGTDRSITVADGTATFDLDISATLSGTNAIHKKGTGALRLQAAANIASATSDTATGTLVLNGSQPAVPVSANGGTIAGTGTVGAVTVTATGAQIEPGALLGTAGFPAKLTTGNLVGTVAFASTLRLRVANGSQGGTSDQLVVRGTVDLSGMTLQLVAGPTTTPAATQSIILISNDGTADPVVGTFVGLPQNTLLTINNQQFRISYTAGDGNDVALIPLPKLSVSSVRASEAAGALAFTVKLSAASPTPVTVNFATSTGGTSPATPGADYTETTGTLTFAPSVTSIDVSIPVVNDTIYEADQTFFFTLSAPVAADLGTAVATGTIQNDDAAPILTFSNVAALEGTDLSSGAKTNVLLTATQTGLTELPFSFRFATRDGTALKAVDYQSASGTVSNSLSFTLTVVPDALFEPDETFFVDLSNPVNCTLATPSIAISILNDDPKPIGPELIGTAAFSVGSGTGALSQFNAASQILRSTQPYPNTPTVEVRTVTADFNGDGIPDLVTVPGPGAASEVRVYDGKTFQIVAIFTAFKPAGSDPTFTGGAYLAAGDVNGDGIPDLIVAADVGGGPRVQVYNGYNPDKKIADFFGIADTSFTGGVRVAVGDIDGDGYADVVVAAGAGGGPRIATFSGKKLTQDGPISAENLEAKKLFGDFFAFEATLVNGTYVAVGDIDGDGKADLIVGGGPGGSPRVSIFAAAKLLDGQLPTFDNPNRSRDLDFFAGSTDSRNGVRLAVKNLDGDNQADLITGSGPGGGQVREYLGKSLTASEFETQRFPDGSSALTRKTLLTFDPFGPAFQGGVFVG